MTKFRSKTLKCAGHERIRAGFAKSKKQKFPIAVWGCGDFASQKKYKKLPEYD